MIRKINADVMKRNNRAEVVRLIRKEPLSRIKLAERTGLTRASISFICEELLKDGVIAEGEKEPSIGGRPATALLLNPAFGVYGGVHITRVEYVVGVCDFAGEVKKQKRGKVEAGDPTASLARIQKDLKELLDGEKNLLGIGITAPGPLCKKEGTLLEVPNFSAWKGLAIRDYFARAFGCVCVLDNYSNALAYAEYQKNPDCGNKYLELIIDSGFGSAVAHVEGGIRLLECELGHTSVNMLGKRCDCGNFGCAELYVNERTYFGEKREQADFYAALASVLVNAVNTFGVEKAVFAGAVTGDFSRFSEKIALALKQRGKEGVQTLKTSLIGKEVFVACNLLTQEPNGGAEA